MLVCFVCALVVETAASQAELAFNVRQSSPQRTFGVSLGDVDGDGDLDAVFADGGLQFQLEHVCLNDGGFSRATACDEIGP